MDSSTDTQRLRDYAFRGSEAAFEALVREHLRFVFSTALRQLGDSTWAEEVAQNVFASLARKAETLAEHRTITGWLYQSTLLECRHRLRSELRRRHRERVAIERGTVEGRGDSVWGPLVPLLDEAMLSLEESERSILLLRFLQEKNLKEVGEGFGISEDAARKRVKKALDSLMQFFQREGFAIPVTASAIGLFSTASQAAPTGLLETILVSSGTTTPIAIGGAGASGVKAGTLSKATILMSAKTSKSILAILLLLLLLGGSYSAYRLHFATVTQDPSARSRGGLTAEEFARLNSVRDGLLRMLTYAGEHQDEFPRSIEQLGRPTLGADGLELDWASLEIVGPRSLREVADPSTTVILQEKKGDRRGGRVRGYADGHSEMDP